ncbi:hypothetical protein C8A00DRAFT_13620 [Chaetomidium leptoderma]|uniref:Fucose-specific lectin n=1 Tax=Chaetomidium leptoderma TaxID=669021 RepID=A0AAN7A034_9PEZI|nr:hypothetical protein C8A00DRAFT_13620 [Chaetomidium leptoderma]
MASLLSKLLLLGAAVSPAQASIAAWWTDIGPQIILQNETTNQIRYSACNSRDQARYSYTDGSVLPLSQRPKIGTPLAGVGWWNQKITVASIFYINDQGNVANGLFNCNMSTGLFQSVGNWVIGNDAPSIHSNSGLAAVVLGSQAGYRVYYHDSDGAVNELGYVPDDDAWTYRGLLSHDINSLPALGAAFSGKDNITVAAPRDEQNIGVIRAQKGDEWERTTLPRPLQGDFTTAETDRSNITLNETEPAPFRLPAWDGTTSGIGVSIDSAFTRSLWYIGNDSSLYQVANQNYTWSQRANQSSAFWPQADKANAELAVAYDFKSSMVRIYYMVKGQLSEVKYENNIWKAWSTVAASTPSPTQEAAPPPTDTDVASDTGLSTGAKAGIGVGVSLGAIALGAIIAVIVLARRKKQQGGLKQPPFPEEGSTTVGPDTPAPSYGSPALARADAAQHEAYAWDQKSGSPHEEHQVQQVQQVQQLDGTTRSELYAPEPAYELPNQPYTHELGTDPHHQRH